jgi:hypothetical protein
VKNKLYLLLFLPLCLFIPSTIQAQGKPLEKVVFKGEESILPGYDGLYFRLSEPFLKFREWDTEHTGASRFSIALEFTNRSEQNISAITFKVKLFSKAGDVAWEGTSGTGPLTFKPEAVNVLEPGYRGVYDGFITQDKSFFQDFGKMEFEIMEISTVGSITLEGPMFPDEWTQFKGFRNLKFKWSDPYIYVDNLSGDERFGIALKFKNESGETLRHMYFHVRVTDMQGQVHEADIQEHNRKYDPPPEFFMDASFPSDYEGVDYHFYSREKSFVDEFNKIDVSLVSVAK